MATITGACVLILILTALNTVKLHKIDRDIDKRKHHKPRASKYQHEHVLAAKKQEAELTR
jgi:uncharacterized MAPEG superfamily protein